MSTKLFKAGYSWLKNTQNWWFPKRCILCMNPALTDDTFCQPCFNTLPWLTQGCVSCGLPIIGYIRCANCLSAPPIFDKFCAVWAYQYPCQSLILDLKFQKRIEYVDTFTKLLAQRILQDYDKGTKKPDYLAAVPIHPKRLAERGFNQSLQLARGLRKHLKIPLISTSCERIKHTKPQLDLTATQRKANLQNAFKVEGDFSYQTIAIVDDVFTTGTTASTLAKAFKEKGAQEVQVYCIARATP